MTPRSTLALLMAVALRSVCLCPAAQNRAAGADAGRDAAVARLARPATNSPAGNHAFRPGQTVERELILTNPADEARRFTYRWEATLGGRPLTGDEDTLEIACGTNLVVPLSFRIPTNAASSGSRLPAWRRRRIEGQVDLVAVVGGRMLKDELAFRVLNPARPGSALVAFDPAGETTFALANLGYAVTAWDARSDARAVIVGRDALSGPVVTPEALPAVARNGGVLLIMGQDSGWLRDRFGFRIADLPPQRVIAAAHARVIARGLDESDLRDCLGGGFVGMHPYARCFQQMPASPDGEVPHYSARLETMLPPGSGGPEQERRGGWRPLILCEAHPEFSPLIELRYGRGRLIICALDLENRAAGNPAAETMLHRLIEHARTPP